MGQATADLPDPLAASGSESTSTDDLLAQLAGEEIERLLAETEISPEPVEVAVVPTPVLAADPPHAPAPASPAPEIAAVATPGSIPTIAPPKDDLESIFTQLDEREKAISGTTSGPAPEVKATEIVEAPSVAEALAAEMAEDEAQHARPASEHLPPTAASGTISNTGLESEQPQSPSPLVSILAIMNSPLDSFPDHVRDLVGKVAILTLLNALCVLAYVVFFRR